MKANGVAWRDICAHLNRPLSTVRDHHAMLIKKSITWDEAMDKTLGTAYKKHRDAIWKSISTEMGLPWQVVEDRVWHLGRKKVESLGKQGANS
jgi:hypothetical protein